VPHIRDSPAADARFNARGIIEDVSETSVDPALSDRVKWNAEGLVPAIVQQHDTGEVLMLAWVDDVALARMIESGRGTYWSRSRQEYWIKGETSGHVQDVREIRLDCDGDTLLVKVDQHGAACHTGDRTCFDAGVVHPR
jgi:phosphoribosyl-AMP cyclohydrolase